MVARKEDVRMIQIEEVIKPNEKKHLNTRRFENTFRDNLGQTGTYCWFER